MELDTMIGDLVHDRKALESDITLKRQAVTTAKASLKVIREKKQKVDMPVFSDFENTLLEYAAAVIPWQKTIPKDALMRSSFKHAIYIVISV